MNIDPTTSARFSALSLGTALLLFFGMLLFLEIGRRISLRATSRMGDAARTGVGVVDSAVYAVLALLLGFMFNGAMTRFDTRRDMVIQEASAMSTAWQRIDALPPAAQATIRTAFTRYVDAVAGVHQTAPGSPTFQRHWQDIAPAQNDLWTRSVVASLADAGGEKARMLLLPSLNEAFDAVDRELQAIRNHPPKIIYVMLLVAALASALFAGYSMANRSGRNWLFNTGIAATIAIVMYVVIQLEYPRLGVVNVAAIDRPLIELKTSLR